MPSKADSFTNYNTYSEISANYETKTRRSHLRLNEKFPKLTQLFSKFKYD